MRCPHCRGEIPQESQFCGVCGQNIHISQVGQPVAPSGGPAAGDAGVSPSLFDLPVSQGARAVRVAMVLGLNLLMLGGGIALFVEYLHKRDRVGQGTSAVSNAGDSAGSDVAPTVAPAVGPGADAGSKAPPPGASGPGPDASAQGAARSSRTDAGSQDSLASTGPSSGKADAAPSPARAPAGSSRVPDAGTRGPASSRPSPRGPDAGLAAARVEPALTEEEQARAVSILAGKIGLVVEQHQAQLGRCYENALKQGSPKDPLEGQIKLHFSVQPNGNATNIRVRSNETGSTVLASCLVGLVGSWTFPSSGSEALDFVWPFEFQAPQ